MLSIRAPLTPHAVLPPAALLSLARDTAPWGLALTVMRTLTVVTGLPAIVVVRPRLACASLPPPPLAVVLPCAGPGLICMSCYALVTTHSLLMPVLRHTRGRCPTCTAVLALVFATVAAPASLAAAVLVMVLLDPVPLSPCVGLVFIAALTRT
jgi:hypothetical protein